MRQLIPDESILAVKGDLRYEPCIRMASRIRTELEASTDPLRHAIVTVLKYDGGDIEEYLSYVCAMIDLLPQSFDVQGHKPGDVDNEGNSFVFGRSY